VGRGRVRTFNKGGMWVNVIEGGELLSEHYMKDAAVAAGRGEAKRRRTEHVIHNVDGTIAQHNSYLPGPHPAGGESRAGDDLVVFPVRPRR
jgi:hypothetical protein